MSQEPTQIPFETRCHKVLQFARDLYRQSPDWVRFFREVVGVDGAARKVFVNQEDFMAFERSDAFHTIKRMVNALRNNKSTSHSEEEATRVITVRLPESLHEALKAEAEDHGTSMNRLCISKLLQVLEEDELQRARAASRPASRTTPESNGSNGVNGVASQRSLPPTPSYPTPATVGSSTAYENHAFSSPAFNSAPSSQPSVPPYRPTMGDR